MVTDADRARLASWVILLEDDANIDRRNAIRTVPMQVLSLGLSRTGTLTLVEAFKILGIPSPYHFSSIAGNVKDSDLWLEGFATKFQGKGIVKDWRKFFDALLGHCGAVTDAPCVHFWQELVDAYPDAKVVLVERDVEKWLPSIGILIEGVLNPVSRDVLRCTDPAWHGRIANLGSAWMGALFGSTSVKGAKANARAAYEAHYASVRATVPKERLLELRLSDGWGPLCEFLGKEVPDVPFPHCNEAKTFDNALGAWVGKAAKHSLFNIAVVVGIGSVAGGLLWNSLR